MFGQGFNYGFLGKPLCFTDTTDIFKDNSGVALYTLDYDASSGKDITTNTLQILGDTSCIATYSLNGSSADLSGNYNGTDTNITYTDGYFGQCASFNGSSSFITISGNMLNSLTAISASAWVYRRTGSSDNYEYILSGGISVSGQRYGIAVNDDGGSGDNKFYITDGASSFHTNTICNYNTWYHVVYTWSGTELKFYVNGSLDSTFTAVNCNFQSSGNGHKIGEYHHNGNYEWEGEIDQVRIFNKAISASEVTTLYNEIGNKNGTPTNVDFGVGGKSLYGARFNGSNSYVDLPLTSIFGGKNTLAVSFWFKTTTTARQRMFTDYAQNSRNCDITIDGGNIEIVTDYGSTSDNHTTTSKYNDGIWNHIVVSINQSTNQRTIYINGILLDTITLPSQSWNGSGQKVTIGAFYSSSSGYSQYFDGKIDQTRIFNKGLSSIEVGELYGNGAGEIACVHTATTTDIAYPIANTAYYKLDNNSKDSARSTGKFNEGAIFNGSSSKIEVSNQVIPNDATSISFWYNPEGSTGTEYILGQGVATASKGVTVYWHSQSFGALVAKGTSSLAGSATGSTTYSATATHHVVFTWDGTSNSNAFKVYVNGSLLVQGTSDTSSSSIGSYTNFAIGGLNGGTFANGTVDQVRIFSKVLSTTEISTLYNETTTTANTLQVLGDTSCVATYQLDGNSTDLSGNYSGTDTDVKYAYDGTETNIEYRFGRYGQAAVFNGSNSYISADNPNSGGGARSFSAWIKTTSTSFQSIITNGGASHASGLNMFVYNNKLYSTSGKGNGENYGPSSSQSINTGNWVHCVLTMSGTAVGSTLKTYVNGILDGTHTTTILITDTYNAFRIGGRYINGSNLAYFNGSIDQVRIFNSELTSSQVTQLYNEKLEIDTSNFKTVLYEGNGSTQYISNVGIDLETGGGLVWLKRRNTSSDHYLVDSVRGNGNDTYKNLSSNTNNTEGTTTSSGIINNAFEANGFIMQGSGARTNANGDDYVAWNWKGSGFQPSQTFSNIKTQGLIAHWNATQNDSLYPGSTWYDLTSNNNDLTHYKTSVSNISISRNNGGAIDMNSTRQFYRSQFVNDQTFTVGGWFRKDANNGNNVTLWSQGYAPTFRLQIYGGSTGDRIYHYLHNGSTSNSYDTGIDVPKTAWFHIMVTYDLSNGTVKLYLNGTLVHTASTITGTFYSGSNSDQYFRVTRNSTNANGYLTGAISQIRVYSDVLTAAEVLNDYNATKNLFQTNNNGTISATVDANQNAGFSIVKYTGNGTAGATVGHGLSAKPQFILFKNLDTVVSWIAYDTINNVIGYLDNTDSLTDGRRAWAVNNTDPTNTLVTLGNNQATNAASNFIMYCWHSVAGYSSIGSYEGLGTSVVTKTGLGFKPSWVLIKNIDNSANWNIYDSRIAGNDVVDFIAYPNLNNSIISGSHTVTMQTDGFQVSATNHLQNNKSGSTYLYMAFK